MQKASKDQDHCQRKNNSDESGVMSCDESGLCQRLENQAANLPNKDATGENSAHKIYPWMKEFRSRGACKKFFVLKLDINRELGGGEKQPPLCANDIDLCRCFQNQGPSIINNEL